MVPGHNETKEFHCEHCNKSKLHRFNSGNGCYECHKCGNGNRKVGKHTPICFLCKKPIFGVVYYQANNREFPAHENCRIVMAGG